MNKLLVLKLAILSFAFSTSVQSQQLIADPGFENWNGTSGNYLGPCFDWYENSALPWPASNMGTPDHHHEANPIGSNLTSADPNCTLTGSNFSGCGGVYQGQGCLGIWTETNASFDGTREVAGTQLTSPMIVGECYKVSFWVQAKTNSSGFYRHISGQGVMFSMTQYPSYDPSTVDYNTLANSYVATDSIISDTIWHYIEMTFTADQAYTHAYVGILGNWADINYQFGTTWGNAVGPYYWFDEVKVEQMASCCETNFNSQVTTDANCGMSDGSMTVDPVGAGPYNYQLFTYPGNVQVASNSTGDFQGIPAGDYYVTIFDAHCTFNSDTLTVGQLGTPTYTLNGTDPTTCGGSDGTIVIGSLTNGTTYNISYVDPLGNPVGPISFTADATGIYTITGLTQGNYTDIEVEFNSCLANIGDHALFDPTGVTLNVSLNPIVQCGDIPEIVLSGLVPGQAYDWSFDTGFSGTGDVADASGEIVVVVVPGTYDNFSATLNSSGCTAINNATIDVLDVTPVNATATASSAGNCIDDGNISFQGLEPGLTYNIYWPGGDTLLAVSSGSGVINVPFPVGTWGQFVVENATTLCTDTLAPLDVVNPIDPNDSIQTIYGIDETCFGANDGEVYVFDFGFLIYDIYIDSVLMSPANSTNLAPGTYEVVKHNTVTGCYVVYNITVNPGPLCCNIDLSSNIDVQPSCGGSDGEITLNIVDNLGPVQYNMDGGTLQSSPSFTGLSAGTYQFVALDSAGCSDTIDVTLTPLNGPTAPVAGTDATYCDGDLMTDLTATVGGGGTLTWYDDAGLTNQVGTGATHTPATTIGVTNYYVTETVAGCESAASTVTITINSVPNAPSAGTDTTYCLGDVMADLTTSATSPNWFDDAALTNNIGTGSTLTPGATLGTTIYYVTETVNGCGSPAATVSVTIHDVPTISDETATDVTSCLSDNGSITITSSANSYELFDASNNSIETNTSGAFTGLSIGDYYVVVSNGNCTVNSNTLSVTDQTTTSSHMINAQACNGSIYTFVDGTSQTISSNVSYVSTLVNSIGCDSLVTENVTVVQPTTTVIDTTICEGTDYTSVGDAANFVNVLNDFQHISVLTGSSGCDSTIIENITVTPAPSIDLGPDFNGCDGEIVTITATVSSGSILWSTGETTNSITVNLLNDTMYYATLTDNCGVDSDTVNINVYGAPIVDAGPDITIPLGATAQLEVTSTTAPISYEWSPSNYLDCINCDDPVSSTPGNITYVVSGMDENGCVGYDTVNITIDGEVTVFIPNIFSPNNDGENDLFQVYGPEWDQYRMQIYNRWGGLVFESEDPSINWDGKHFKNQEDCPQAVFIYKFWGISRVGGVVERAGNVMLSR